jgi:hypothetical protein
VWRQDRCQLVGRHGIKIKNRAGIRSREDRVGICGTPISVLVFGCLAVTYSSDAMYNYLETNRQQICSFQLRPTIQLGLWNSRFVETCAKSMRLGSMNAMNFRRIGWRLDLRGLAGYPSVSKVA